MTCTFTDEQGFGKAGNDGARTMGFWQNKNGQGIIKGEAPTGPCPSGTWLRQFHPFSDLPAGFEEVVR